MSTTLKSPRWRWVAIMRRGEEYVGAFEVVVARPTSDTEKVKMLAATQVPAELQGKVSVEVSWGWDRD